MWSEWKKPPPPRLRLPDLELTDLDEGHGDILSCPGVGTSPRRGGGSVFWTGLTPQAPKERDMADQPTCGQGLAQNSPLRTKLGELVGSTSGVLEIHMAALDPGDEDTGLERRAYQRLAQEHREIGARLLVLGEEMAGYRDLPMGRHDPRVMASPPAVEAF